MGDYLSYLHPLLIVRYAMVRHHGYVTSRFGMVDIHFCFIFSVILEVISFYQVNENEEEENKVEDKVKGRGKKRKKDKGKGKGKDKRKLAQKVDETREVKRKEQEQDAQVIKAIRGVVSNKYIAIGDHGRLETTVSILSTSFSLNVQWNLCLRTPL